jgi:molecular chaperone GrpE
VAYTQITLLLPAVAVNHSRIVGDHNQEHDMHHEPGLETQPHDGGEDTEEASPQELRSQLDQARDQHLRLAADFANFRKRSRQAGLEIAQEAAAALAQRLLPVLDDGERALEQLPSNIEENWLKGIRLTLQKLRDALAAVGVEPIEAVGQEFDPRLHEAIGSEESSQNSEGVIVRELRRGYRIGDRVLRPSLVKVARGPERRAGEAQPSDGTAPTSPSEPSSNS